MKMTRKQRELPLNTETEPSNFGANFFQEQHIFTALQMTQFANENTHPQKENLMP